MGETTTRSVPIFTKEFPMSDVKTFFEETMAQKIAGNADTATEVGAVFLFEISGEGGGTWTVNLKDAPGVAAGDAGNAECTISCAVEDWATLSADPSQAMPLFFSGKLKVSGNPMLATKLQQLLG